MQLINTPAGLAAVVHGHNGNEGSGDANQGIAYSLLTPCLIYGEPALLDAYLDKLGNAMVPLTTRTDSPGQSDAGMPAPLPLTQYSAALQWIADIQHALRTPRRPLDVCLPANTAIDLKHDFTGPLNHLLTTLGLIYGYAEREPSALLQRLAQDQRFAPAFLTDWRWALATVQTLRVKTQLAAGTQRDIVAWGALSAAEQAALHAIEYRVMRPLLEHMRSACQRPAPIPVPAVIAQLQDWRGCDPAIAARPDSMGAVVLPDLTPSALRSLAATLAHRRVDVSTCLAYYRASLARAPAQRWASWTIWRDELERVPDMQPVLAAVRDDPCANGWRGGWEDEMRAFHRHVRTWFAEPGAAPAADALTMRAAILDASAPEGDALPIRDYVLKPAIAEQLLAAGRLRGKPGNRHGRDVVLPVTFEIDGKTLTYWLKLAPENPATETLVHALDCRLGGGRETPNSVLVVLRIGGQTIAAQILEGIAGDALDTVLATNPQRLARLDHAAFTRTLLRVLLINPEDDKGDDYRLVVQPDGRDVLRRLDNERAFFAVDDRTGLFKLSPTLRVKSQLYCLAQMAQPLDADTLAAFCRIEPLQLLESWLQDAEGLRQYYQPCWMARRSRRTTTCR